ncbi:tyrosine-type recombinase/integrase [Streptomyces sp. TRM 70361]|uniref:tyrosine-type recombinase/integrase n=1 Tax=Streptomyces sp. TRM 70361 TaxID=3116553 RepID=UPI002E7B3C35|nr:tyrosine-type recombinase/integrase [Streptomyces sp. TRM 70361]MEE1942530.1 tyrosine-type recombinase/integrase [Streptomyces sp. TRM 70361]
MTAATGDEAFLLTERQCSAILDAVGERPQDGRVLRAFLATIALAALRPAEALALRVRDLELSDGGPNALLVRPQGRTGHRSGISEAEAVRSVPACSDLVAILKAEITRRGLGPDDALFTLDEGRPLTGETYRRVWKHARAAVLEAHGIDSPLGRNVSALRDACIAAWLRNGDQTAAHIAAVAECAGVSAPRLAERFSHCLRKPTPAEVPWDRLEAAFRLPTPRSEPMTTARRP